MPTYDGSVLIKTDIDDKDAQKRLRQLEKDINKLQADINKGNVRRSAIAEQLQQARDKAAEARKEIERIKDTVVDTPEFIGLNKELETAKKQADNLAHKMNRFVLTGGDKGSTVFKRMEYDADALDRKIQTLTQRRSEMIHKGTYTTTLGESGAVTAELREQEALLARQEASIEKLEDEDRTRAQEIAIATEQLQAQEMEVDRINAALTEQSMEAWPKVRAAADRASVGFSKGLKALVRYGLGMRSLFVLYRKLRTVLVEGIKEYAKYDQTTANSINGLKSALSGLKGALVSAFAPIFNAVAPALQTLIDLVSRAASAIAAFVAVLGGKTTYSVAVSNLEAVGGAASGAAGAVEDLKKQMSGLDEMNKWQESSSGGGGGSVGGGSGLEFEDVPIDTGSTTAKIAEFVRANLESVALLVEEFGFILGVILLFTGHVPLGLGFMLAFGYAGIKNVTENWDAIKAQLQGSMGSVYTIVGGALLVLGAILAFSGASIPIGIAMMAIGAADLVTMAVVNWNSQESPLRGVVSALTIILSGAALVLGAMLAFSGVGTGLGIALIAMGAAGLATVAALNWSSLDSILSGSVGRIVAIASGAALALGIILCLSGVGMPLGIGLIAAGSAGLAATTAVNWNTITEKIQGVLNGIKDTWNTWKENHPVIAGILDTIFGVAVSAVGAAANFAVTFVGKIGEGWNSIQEAWKSIKDSEAVKTIKGKAAETWETIKSAWGQVVSEPSIKTIKGAIATTGTAAWSLITTAWGTIKNSDAVKTIKGAIQKTGSGIWSTMTSAWNTIKESEVTKTIKGAIQKTGSGIWSTMTSAWNAIKTSPVTKTIKGAIQKTGSGIWSTMKSAWNAIKSVSVTKTIQGTKKIGAKAWAAIKTAWEAIETTTVTKTITGVATAAFTNIKKLWDSITNKTTTVTLDGHSHSSGKFAQGGVYSGGRWHEIAQYASGVSRAAMGQIFIAREAGPELVGTLKGHTAVMNNDQIVASVSAGVAKAISNIRFAMTGLPAYPAVTEDMLPAVALGEVIPPRLLEVREDLDGIRSMLERIAARLDNGGGGNTYNLTATANGRVLFDLMLQEGQNRAAITGRNPFFLNLGGA